jgi:putative transposase
MHACSLPGRVLRSNVPRGGVDPKTFRRDRPPDIPKVRKEMKLIASKRRRFGYRRIGVLLERKGMIMNHKKLYRLYTEERLGVRRRRGRKRARGSRTPMPVAVRPGERWSLDFVSDTSDTFGASTARQGRRTRMFTCMRGTQVPHLSCER